MSTYLYTRADGQGQVVHQGVFKTFQQVPPRLARLEDGNITVTGGLEEEPNTMHESLADGQKKLSAPTRPRPCRRPPRIPARRRPLPRSPCPPPRHCRSLAPRPRIDRRTPRALARALALFPELDLLLAEKFVVWMRRDSRLMPRFPLTMS